jgi:hypothetical protein
MINPLDSFTLIAPTGHTRIEGHQGLPSHRSFNILATGLTFLFVSTNNHLTYIPPRGIYYVVIICHQLKKVKENLACAEPKVKAEA